MHRKIFANFARATLSLAALSTAASGQAEPPPLDAYGELPEVEDIAIAPSGGSVAMVVQIKGQRRVAVVDDAGKVPFNLATGPSKIRGVQWADDGTILVTKSETVGLGPGFTQSRIELTGTIIIPLDTKKMELVFARTKAIADTTRGAYGIRKLDGKTVGYYGGLAMDVSREGVYFRHGRTTLYAVDLAKNMPRQVAPPPAEGHWRDWQIDGAGNVAATMDLTESNGSWKITNAKGVELARGVDPNGDISMLCLGKDGTTLLYSIADEAGDDRWMEVPLTGGAAVEFLPNQAVERIYVDGRSGNLIGYRLKGGKPQTVMFDPARQKAVSGIFRAFAKRDVALMDWNADFTKIIVRTSGNRDSGTWYLVDMSTHKADPIGDERTRIPQDEVGPISLVSYKAADGLEMDGILTLPPGREAKNLPVVVLPHGGPAAHDTLSFDWWAQAFASRGYAVFQPNFRGSTNRNEAFIRAGDAQWGHKMQTDLSDGLAELARQGTIDPKRACIVGGSYGGYAALAGVTLQHGIYRCAVSFGGISDVAMMYRTDVYESGNSKMTWRALRRQLGDTKGYDAISPRRFAATADAPILLIHGKDDTVVPLNQSTVMANALKNAGKPYEMVVLPGEDHWLSTGETRKKMLQSAVDFVQKNNPAN